jgi:hypothetical protein
MVWVPKVVHVPWYEASIGGNVREITEWCTTPVSTQVPPRVGCHFLHYAAASAAVAVGVGVGIGVALGLVAGVGLIAAVGVVSMLGYAYKCIVLCIRASESCLPQTRRLSPVEFIFVVIGLPSELLLISAMIAASRSMVLSVG